LKSQPDGFVWPSRKGITKILDQSAAEFLVNCKNHVATNFCRLHKKYLKVWIRDRLEQTGTKCIVVEKEKEVEQSTWSEKSLTTLAWNLFRATTYTDDTLVTRFLFSESFESELKVEIRRVRRRIGEVSPERLQANWASYLPWMFYILRTFEAEHSRIAEEVQKADEKTAAGQQRIRCLRRALKGVRLFTLLPDRRPHLFHFTLTDSLLRGLLCQWIPKSYNNRSYEVK
jgi:hypothetical protein